jgi:DNA-binding SARP family transcriptional activator
VNHPEIKIFLFGPFEVECDGRPIKLGIGGVTKSLLAYLISRAGMPERRERLADIFWPEAHPDKARSAMNTAIWRIKKALSPYADLRLECFEDTVCLQIGESVQVDAVQLVTQLKRCQSNLSPDLTIPRDRADLLAASVRKYRGQFLDGLAAHWALVERERYVNFYIRALMILLHNAGERGNYEEALGYGRRILAEDPFRETIQREMMWIYVMNGQRAQAIMQFQDLATKLDEELGIGPMTETVALFTHILNGISAQRELTPAGPPISSQSAVFPDAKIQPDLFEAVRESRRTLYHSLSTPLI